MPTFQVDMSKWAGTDVTGPLTVAYDGATPTDPGPAGVVLRMLIAQASNDEAGLRACVTAKTMEMGKPAVPGKALSVHLSPATEEGDRQIVNAKLSADGADQEVAFILIQEAGDWRVDMPLTIERLMGGSMQQFSEMLEQGMKQMADGRRHGGGNAGPGRRPVAGVGRRRRRRRAADGRPIGPRHGAGTPGPGGVSLRRDRLRGERGAVERGRGLGHVRLARP
jgi:hypothetical protein